MAFGNALDTEDDVVSEINMVPLIDVMLVLLVVFIVTVPVLTHSVRLDLPRADNRPNLVEPRTVSLSVTADGGIHWNEERIDGGELERRLAAAAASDPQPEVHLRGDRKVEYEHVARVMAAVQRSGLSRLGFMTEPSR